MCDAMGCRCITSYDVGVAGMQRIFPALKEMIREDVDCIVVVAGMEGALATLVSSMVDIPVIGVPTSVGYGYGQKGMAALASMLQSCSSGLSVVNIDNGIAAGGIAANIANRAARKADCILMMREIFWRFSAKPLRRTRHRSSFPLRNFFDSLRDWVCMATAMVCGRVRMFCHAPGSCTPTSYTR